MKRTCKPSFTITIQRNHFGGSEKVAYAITPAKAQKIIDLLTPERQKKQKAMRCTSITLDQFFSS